MELQTTIQDFISNTGFPCVGAKTALAKGLIRHYVAGALQCPAHDAKILAGIREFIDSYREEDGPFSTFMVLFPNTSPMTDEEFEIALWQRLQGLHEGDAEAWDPSTASNPDDPKFSMSLGGKSFYIIGLHPHSSRKARQFPVPAMVFNLHEQFEKLREEGTYGNMRNLIRRRDRVYSGSVNPMLENFGDSSEARQYAGRQVDSTWRCPFQPKVVNE